MVSADQLLNNLVDQIVNPLIILMFAVALVYFLWGVFNFIKDANNEDARNKGRVQIMWGLVGLFIMVSAFAIINISIGTFGIRDTTGIIRGK